MPFKYRKKKKQTFYTRIKIKGDEEGEDEREKKNYQKF